MSISRRGFISSAALAGVTAGQAAGVKHTLPKRILGRTGVQVSVLAFGCGSRFLMYREEDKALEAVQRALDMGITYLDTAFSYGQGLSETRVGKVMATRRKEVFLATKMQERNGEKVQAIIEASLKRLQTDQLDLIHIHELKGEDDLARIEAKDGILNTLLRLRDQKVTKFIGITCHNDPTVLKTALERHDFDCVQMALNAALSGMKVGKNPAGATAMVINPEMKMSFETVALPVARKKNMGIIAMKVFAADGLAGQATPEKLLYYALSLPVSTASVGMPTLDLIEENTKMARSFKPLTSEEMMDMSGSLSSKNKMALDHYLQHHQDEFTAV
ncbi:MAG: aldo/keto reductase [Bryobacteraceae bacterium]